MRWAHQANEQGLSAYTGGGLHCKDAPVRWAAAVVVTEEQREHYEDAPAQQQHRPLAPGWRLISLALVIVLCMRLSLLATGDFWLLNCSLASSAFAPDIDCT